MKSKLHFCCMHVWVVVMIFLPSIGAMEKGFKVSFQYDGNWSGNAWVEYLGNITSLKEFTVCHWEKLRYLAPGETTVWTYCSISSKNDAPFRCIGVYSSGARSSANRMMKIQAWLEGWTTPAITVSSEPIRYRHRTWNHICWIYSGKKAINKFYWNGVMIGYLSLNLEHKAPFDVPVIDGSKDAFKSAFIIGQDQDSVKGGFSAAESFYGEIAGLNMWDSDIGSSKINALAQCKSFELGNVVSSTTSEC